MTETTKGALYAALAQAQERCKSVGKDGKNEHHGYRYASAEAIYTEARSALEGTGLSLLPTSSKVEMRETVAGPPPKFNDGTKHDPTAKLPALWLVREFDLVHSGGESRSLRIEWPIVLDRGRTLDKAVAGAETSSLAYLYRDLLSMPRVDARDDMNHESRDAEALAAEAFERAQREQAAKRPPPRRAPPSAPRKQPPQPPPHNSPTPSTSSDQQGGGERPSSGDATASKPDGNAGPKAASPTPAPAPADGPSPELLAIARRIGPSASQVACLLPGATVPDFAELAVMAEVERKVGAKHPLVVRFRRKYEPGKAVDRSGPQAKVENWRGFLGAIGSDVVKLAAEAQPKPPEAPTGGADRAVPPEREPGDDEEEDVIESPGMWGGKEMQL